MAHGIGGKTHPDKIPGNIVMKAHGYIPYLRHTAMAPLFDMPCA